jgi:hypothetical protein
LFVSKDLITAQLYQDKMKEKNIDAKTPIKKGIDNRPNITALPGGRKSAKVEKATGFGLAKNYGTVSMDYIRKIIPILRGLMMKNEDVGQAIHNIVTLGNTGHKIFFDQKVKPEMVDAMRNHLINKRKEWASGQAGMDGLVNRWLAQILLSGALSNEWVPNSDLTGIESVILVNPEEIEFLLDGRGTKYKSYQIAPMGSKRGKSIEGSSNNLILLNPNTYRYFALNGDGEIPYGFPPYLSVIPKLTTQSKMNKNIDFVIDQMGLMGFIEALISKPDMIDGETDPQYEIRLDSLLTKAKERLLGGFKEGVVVGIKDDHEFKFNSASKSYSDAVELYKNNELMVASALKQDASMWGRDYSTSETQITVVFIKMLSELKNIHSLIKANLEFGYSLELRLAGYSFDNLQVKFNRSTIQDDLKYQQAMEIKIRNVKDKLILGIINQDMAADELDYDTPSFDEPMVSWEVLAGGSDPSVGLETDGTKKKADTKKKKTASDKRVRDKNKTIPKN